MMDHDFLSIVHGSLPTKYVHTHTQNTIIIPADMHHTCTHALEVGHTSTYDKMKMLISGNTSVRKISKPHMRRRRLLMPTRLR